MNWKMIFWTVLAVAVMSMSGCLPGSDQWNIKRAARCYVKEGGLQEGETLVFVNGIQRKCGCEWQGESCKYAAVKYTVRSVDGNKEQRMIHLLMDERCKRVLDCSYDGKAEWVRADGLVLFNYINK